jgi:hypothetical protein
MAELRRGRNERDALPTPPLMTLPWDANATSALRLRPREDIARSSVAVEWRLLGQLSDGSWGDGGCGKPFCA